MGTQHHNLFFKSILFKEKIKYILNDVHIHSKNSIHVVYMPCIICIICIICICICNTIYTTTYNTIISEGDQGWIQILKMNCKNLAMRIEIRYPYAKNEIIQVLRSLEKRRSKK